MSNVGRSRTGHTACQYCKSTERDSNGQCHCRNIAYRALRGNDKAKAFYDSALKASKGDIVKALQATREEFPSLVKPPADRKASVKKAVKKAEADLAAETKDAETKAEPERYILVVKDDFTDPFPYARKDAAIKNGIRSGDAWEVTYKGKVVAQSDDLI